MCIICAKPAGIALPTEKTIRRMFARNPDGAGIMYTNGKHVKIVKGLMKVDEFLRELDRIKTEVDTTQEGMVLHFRIGTAGGNIPANTHPFPITDSLPRLQRLRCATDIGIAHNGIIDIRPRQKNISDTMEYIMSQLAPLKQAVPEFYRNKHLMLMIKNAISSKMAFLLKDKSIYTIGEFIEEDGLLYSNYTYQSYDNRSLKWNYAYLGGWDSGDWDDWDDEFDSALPSGYGKTYSNITALSSYRNRHSTSLANENELTKEELLESGLSPLETAITLYSGNAGHYILSMYLDNGEFVKGEDGEMYSSDDAILMIDEDGNVYTYDFDEDTAFYTGGTAYDEAGGFLRFSYQRAEFSFAKGGPLADELDAEAAEEAEAMMNAKFDDDEEEIIEDAASENSKEEPTDDQFH